MAESWDDRTGERFGRWTVTGPSRHMAGEVIVPCRCDCGTVQEVWAGNLPRANGCAKCTATPLSAGTLRQARPVEYRAWQAMKRRCVVDYSDRGIRTCQGWRRSFAQFFADLGPRPSPEHSVDRRDNDGHYSCGRCDECRANAWPMNCRWATRSEQAVNRRSTQTITVNGVTRCFMHWAKLLGVAPHTINKRLALGWTPEEAAVTPKGQPRPGRHINVGGSV
jgi:hypothetical protein